MLITFGPDGIYGHYDHIAVHRWATIAYDLAADPACFADVPGEPCQPHQVSKLYYRIMPQEQVETMRSVRGAGGVMMDGVLFPMVGWRKEHVTTIIDVRQHLKRKLEGIRCHATQIGRQNRWVDDPAVQAQEWFWREHFVRAQSSVPDRPGIEDDLFAGL